MRNLATCELDKRRHLVTDVRTSKRHMVSSTCLVTRSPLEGVTSHYDVTAHDLPFVPI